MVSAEDLCACVANKLSMLTRQKIILALIDLAGGRAERLQLVKWAFLFGEEYAQPNIGAFYQFVPYKYGPYSFLLWHELTTLARDGVISFGPENQIVLALASAEHRELAPKYHVCTQRFWSDYGELQLDELLNAVYLRYPWFASNSVLRPRRACGRPAVPAIYTAGYGGGHVDGFLNHLLRKGIRRVVDVRHNPCSRHYGFHGHTLSRLCGSVGIGYEHFPELGVPPLWRQDLTSPEAVDRVLARYADERLLGQDALLRRLAGLFRTVPSVLICQEADPKQCHRSRLVEELASRSILQVVHL